MNGGQSACRKLCVLVNEFALPAVFVRTPQAPMLQKIGLMKEGFSLRVDRVEDKGGLVFVHGKWLTGSALDAESVAIERTGKPLSVHEVHFGEEPHSLLLVCGRYMPAAREVAPGDRLVSLQTSSQIHS
jgi:hypothetical protein